MSNQANIRDIQVLSDLKSAFGKFGEELQLILPALQKEFEEIDQRFEERQRHWARQVEEAEEAAHAARRELSDCQDQGSSDDEEGGEAPDCSYEEEQVEDAEKLLTEYEENLEKVKQWRHRIKSQIADFQNDIHNLSNLASSRTFSAQTFLRNKLNILGKYVSDANISEKSAYLLNDITSSSQCGETQQICPDRPDDRRNPLSRFLSLNVDDSLRLQIKNAINAIDEVHDCGNLPKIPVLDSKLKSNGYFQTRRELDGAAAVHIGVSKSGPWPALTTVHEAGHFLDLEALAVKGKYASKSNDPIIRGVMKAANHTNAVQILQQQLRQSTNIEETEYLRYLLGPTEVWARAYAQFIAQKSSGALLKSQLEKKLDLELLSDQWTEEDFAPVADEIEKMFKKINWL